MARPITEAMGIASTTAISGLNAASLRLQVAANNIANSRSDGPLPDAANAGDFPPAYTPLRVNQTDVVGGGTLERLPPPFRLRLFQLLIRRRRLPTAAAWWQVPIWIWRARSYSYWLPVLAMRPTRRRPGRRANERVTSQHHCLIECRSTSVCAQGAPACGGIPEFVARLIALAAGTPASIDQCCLRRGGSVSPPAP